MGRKLGWGVSAPFFGEGSSVPVLYSVARDEAYLHAKFHFDPSNRLATVHQRCRQNRHRTGQRHKANRFTNGRQNLGVM